jgi:tRNA-splicing ligase RtcB
VSGAKVDAPVLSMIRDCPIAEVRNLIQLAENQLGTVGSGNHYVDIVEDVASGDLWVGVHFGSRGFGHKLASGFMNIARNLPFESKAAEGDMMSPPLVIRDRTAAGIDYITAMTLAGDYAADGRRAVVARVLAILGNPKTGQVVHNHHNFTWRETHNGETFWVVRKGATPAFPGQAGFVGGSMGDIAVILEGVESDQSRASLYSTVHGAGWVMSRTQPFLRMSLCGC